MYRKHLSIAAIGIAAALAVAASTPQSQADVIAFDNLGPHDDFDPHGVTVRGPEANMHHTHGTLHAPFFRVVPEASGGITQITFPLLHHSGSDDYTFQVRADDHGHLGQVIGHWPAPSDTNIHHLPLTIEADGTVHIEEGEAYWFGIMPDTDSRGFWLNNAFGDDAPLWVWHDMHHATFHPHHLMGALRVLVHGEGNSPCSPDWNGDGVVDSDDLFNFLSDWASGNADYNGDGVTDSDDLFEFLSDWAAGC